MVTTGLIGGAMWHRQKPSTIRRTERARGYVADNKTFCVYLARDEDIIRKHAEISGFPAPKITEVRKMIDLTTERPD
jgi:hypothetical protein